MKRDVRRNRKELWLITGIALTTAGLVAWILLFLWIIYAGLMAPA